MHSKNFVEMMNFASNSTVDYLESSTYILIACRFSKGQRSLDSGFGNYQWRYNLCSFAWRNLLSSRSSSIVLSNWSSFKTSKKFLLVHSIRNVLLISESPKFLSFITSKIFFFILHIRIPDFHSFLVSLYNSDFIHKHKKVKIFIPNLLYRWHR